MIFLYYILTVAAVVWFSVVASRYIDMIDRTTRLSGAFLGGVLLSAVTSLPELFTSISATVLLDSPSLCIGNILGSNLFNLGMLAVVILFFLRRFASARLSRSHMHVIGFLLLMYIAVAANMRGWISIDISLGNNDFPWLRISITSLLLTAFYIMSIRYLAADNGVGATNTEQPDDEKTTDMPLRSIVARFVAASVGIIATSIVLTYITDDIAETYHLGSGLAGALFLGIATSLPEVTSTISLFRMRNFNIAFGNITGSNVFNFLILAIADLLYTGYGVYDFSDSKVINLTLFGLVATVAVMALLRIRTTWGKALCAAITAACYIAFLTV